jgi:DNA-binding NarL/FixJ family response regulator
MNSDNSNLSRKIKILIVDDVNDYIDNILSLLIASSLSNAPRREDLIQLAKAYFDIQIFNIVGDALAFWKTDEARHIDIAVIDLNFDRLSRADILNPEEYGELRGADLIQEVQKQKTTTVFCNTQYLTISREKLKDVLDVKTQILDKNNPKEIQIKLQNCLKKFAFHYFSYLKATEKYDLYKQIKKSNKEDLPKILSTIQKFGNTHFALEFLLIGWAEAHRDPDTRQTICIYDNFNALEILKTKIKILIVDDANDQINKIKALLINDRHLRNEGKVELANSHFEIKTFNCVGDAINLLEHENYSPDLAFCDWDFQQLSTHYPDEERTYNRGLALIQAIEAFSPTTKTILHTLHLDAYYREINNKVKIEIYGIQNSFKDLETDIPPILKSIATRYFQKLERDPKKLQQFQKILNEVTTLEQLLEQYIVVGTSNAYCLRDLLLGWATGRMEPEPKLEYPLLENLKNEIHQCFSVSQSADLVGNLSKTPVLNILNAYQSHPNHSNWVVSIREDVAAILQEVNYRWNSVHVAEPKLENPIIKNLQDRLDKIINGHPNLDDDTLDILLRLLKCRLIVISIWFLKMINNKYLPSVKNANILPFSILVVIRNDFTGYERHRNKGDSEAIIRATFSTRLGLRGRLAQQNIQETLEKKCFLTEEKEWLEILKENSPMVAIS